MKFIKIAYGEKIKKISFKQEYRTIGELFKLISSIFNILENNIKIQFYDIENTLIDIEDDFDLEYFIESNNHENSAKILVSLKQDLNEITELESFKNSSFTHSNFGKEMIEVLANVQEQQIKEIESKKVDNQIPIDIDFVNSQNYLKIDQQKIQNLQKLNDDKNDDLKSFIELQDQDSQQDLNQIPVDIDFIQSFQSLKIQPEKINELKKSSRQINNEKQSNQSFIELKEQEEYSRVIDINSNKVTIKKIPSEKKEEQIEIKQEKIEKKQQPNFEIRTSHTGVTCDHCDTYPIIGKRFRCLVCVNFDLCEKCENETIHDHPMIRMISQNDRKSLENMTLEYSRRYKH